MKILFVAANPLSTDHLALDEELRAIEQEIAQARYRDKIQLRSSHATRPTDLIRALNREQPDVLHVSSHGEKSGGIVLAGSDGKPHVVSSADIAQLLSALEKPPKLVVLNACFSFSQADEMVKVVDVLVGIPGVVQDQNAVEFSTIFYITLCDGLDIQRSFRQAVVGVKFSSTNYWQDGEPLIMNKAGSSTSVKLVDDGQEVPPYNPDEVRADRRVFSDRDLGRGFLKREFKAFSEPYNALSIIFLDVDGMNVINSRFGRDVGDRVLAQIVLLLEENTPSAIAIGICGDDTFFCVFENRDRQDVMRFGRSLMTVIETHSWMRLASELYVRVTGGFAIWDEEREPATDLIVRAGLALRKSQAESREILEGTEVDVARRLRGSSLQHDRSIPEDVMRQLFS